MPAFNLVILVGNLTRAVELSYTPAQVEVATFGLAVNKKYTTKAGEKKDSVLFIDCVCFGKNAINLNKYTSKGSPILISGELQLDSWEKDGQKYSKHKVLVQSFQFLGSPKQSEQPKSEQSKTEADDVSF